MRRHHFSKAASECERMQYVNAERAFRRWARFNDTTPRSYPRCTLPELITLGVHIPSGYAESSDYYPDVLHTHRVWVFMDPLIQRVVYMHYCYGGSKTRKAALLGVSRNRFNRLLQHGLRFYIKYCVINFNKVFRDYSYPRHMD